MIASYLRLLRAGEGEKAFHGLMDAGREVLPDLISTWRGEKDAKVRAFAEFENGTFVK